MTAAEAKEYREYVERMHGPFCDDWQPFRLLVVSGDVLAGPEHAANGEATVCGIPASEIAVMRHLFRADAPHACPACAADE